MTKLFSRVTDQGTAMAEATLCEMHKAEPFITYANVVADGADDVGTPEWFESTDNESVACVECGIDTVADYGYDFEIQEYEEPDIYSGTYSEM